ncbi:MAG: uroporphyrinogen-III synthase, partial [Crocinitomicaceae bacterium]|nr:uroporphyrinogen-III synthase [Crocinitomicaceae bacterium]
MEGDYDIIFFGSPRAVTFFTNQERIDAQIAIACIGKKTAEQLQKKGYTVDFIGSSSSNPDEIGQTFKEWCGKKKVLFPISNRSLRSIASFFNIQQKIEVVVY